MLALRTALVRIGWVAACATSALALQASKLDVCPWCRNDPELLQRAGLVSHGPLPIGETTSVEFVNAMGGGSWFFLESTHIRWASSLPEVKVDLDEQERVRAELARLRIHLPAVPEKTK